MRPPVTTGLSGTITTGGAAQTLAAANANRQGLWVQNQSTAALWINFEETAVASQPSIKIDAGALYETPANWCPIGSVSIIGATTGQAFAAREWE